MSNAYFHTIFENSKPRCAVLKYCDNYEYFELFRQGAKKPIKAIKDNIAAINKHLLEINDSGKVVVSGFKNYISCFNLPIEDMEYNIYDLHQDHLLEMQLTNNQAKDRKILKAIVDKFECKQVSEYQKHLANAAIVYQFLQNQGVIVNDTLMKPEWSLNTFSGRSKSLGFNIQGHHHNDKVRVVDSSENYVLLHFDWISADIRVASILSGDTNLGNSFIESDPYTHMVNFINNKDFSRDECKIFLLKSINSMSNNDVLSDIYPKLGKWIEQCYSITRSEDGELETILGRRFKVSKSKNQLAVFNGVMQGSVAHAMHNVIRKVWNSLGSYIIADIHDSLVLSVPNEGPLIRSIIDLVSPIMMYPFAGLTDINYDFPMRVSIGKRWKDWQLFEIHKKSGIERVKRSKAKEAPF